MRHDQCAQERTVGCREGTGRLNAFLTVMTGPNGEGHRPSAVHEGVLVDAIHAARGRCAAIVINGGAFSHYAYALTDALAMFDGAKIEVHLSNPYARERWRHRSVFSPVVDGAIVGLKATGYRLAVEAAADLIGTS